MARSILKAELLVAVGANGQVDGIVLLAQAREGVPVDGAPELDVDAAVQDPVDLGLQALARQAVARDAVAEHAAQMAALLEDGYLVPHDGQVVGARESGGAAADDRDAPVGLWGEPRAIVTLHVFGCKALEREDVQRVVHHAAAAVHLAGVLAHEATHQGQRVVLADELHRVGVAPLLDEAHVAGDVHVGGAAGDARRLLGPQLEAAGALVNVVLEVVAEALDGREGHLTGLEADGAVARKVDRAGGLLYELKRAVVGATLQDVLEKVVQGPQADAAGSALAAALRGAQAHEGGGELDRARRERAHGQAPSQGVVQVVHDGLGVAALHHVKTCHMFLSFVGL